MTQNSKTMMKLAKILVKFCKDNNLEPQSADDILSKYRYNPAVLPSPLVNWLERYIKVWEMNNEVESFIYQNGEEDATTNDD